MPFNMTGTNIAKNEGTDARLHDLSMRVGGLAASIEGIKELSSMTRADLKQEAESIRRAIDGLTAEISRDFDAYDARMDKSDARMDRMEIILAEQAAEARGVRKAIRWGGVALTALGSGIGWVMATWGNAITSALGFGGPPNGGK